jgi:type 1 glutamine amidotransferase
MVIRGVFGDYYHAAAPYVNALRKALASDAAALDAVCYPSAFDPAILGTCDVFVLCKEGVVPGATDYSVRWMDRAGEDAIERFVAGGGLLFGWHSGLASYDPEGPVHALYGGHFHGHPPQHRFELCPSGAVRPPYAPRDVLPMSDELYRFSVTSDKADIWLEGHSPDHGVHPVGWSRAHGKGKVVCLSIAHENANLTHPVVQTMLRGIALSTRL